MDTKTKKAALLCNYEVLILLNELKEQSSGPTQANSQLATILYETSHYLQDSVTNIQDASYVQGIMEALRDFPVKLTLQEKLMIVNNPPTSSLELSLLVRDADERLTEEQIEDLLGLISEHARQKS